MILLQITHNPITAEQWSQITTAAVWLWSFVGCIIIMAGSILVGYGIIPSLTSTHDLPARFYNFRVVFFALAGAFLLLAMFSLVEFLTYMTVLYDIFNRVWI
ncbi:MAG TPA: hypothetical protein VFI42_15395 [Thermomicrobiaceae bacterium]|nr:hypothetical protein [Thermomicrobiaceae bacterium]